MHALMQKYDKDENIPELEITELKSIEYAAIIWKIDVVEAAVLFTRWYIWFGFLTMPSGHPTVR